MARIRQTEQQIKGSQLPSDYQCTGGDIKRNGNSIKRKNVDKYAVKSKKGYK
jgi:hypothetical protein